jgi:menaquinone-dependent protoporphyrinogen oxidase
MAKILLIYSTTDGHTLEISRRLRQVIEQHGHQASLVSIDEVLSLELAEFDKLVIGASIRYGKHNPKVAQFIKLNQTQLESKPNGFFSVNVVARKPEKNQPDTNPYLRKFLKQISWKPQHLAVFAGKLDYPSYTIFDRFMIRLIMKITKGPTDKTQVYEFTDWRQVEEFGHLIAEM